MQEYMHLFIESRIQGRAMKSHIWPEYHRPPSRWVEGERRRYWRYPSDMLKYKKRLITHSSPMKPFLTRSSDMILWMGEAAISWWETSKPPSYQGLIYGCHAPPHYKTDTRRPSETSAGRSLGENLSLTLEGPVDALTCHHTDGHGTYR